jgi:hypothetical protein
MRAIASMANNHIGGDRHAHMSLGEYFPADRERYSKHAP